MIYGTIKSANSWNPLWANFRYYKLLWGRTKTYHQFFNKVKVWIFSPEWTPSKESLISSEVVNHSKYDKKTDSLNNYIIIAQFFLTFLFFGFILNMKSKLNLLEITMLGVIVLWSLTNIGGLQESKTWVKHSQLILLIYFCAVMSVSYNSLKFTNQG